MIAIRPAVLSVVQQRFKSNTPTTDGLDKPIENKVDPTADPKQTCKIYCFLTRIVLNQMFEKISSLIKTWLIHGTCSMVPKDLK